MGRKRDGQGAERYAVGREGLSAQHSLNFFLGNREPQQVFEQGTDRVRHLCLRRIPLAASGRMGQRDTSWKTIVIKFIRHARGFD